MTESVKKLISRRAIFKGRITQDFKALDSLDESEINFHLLDQYIVTIESNLATIDQLDIELCTDRSED